VLHQLRCGGVLEAVRISCAGFPSKRPFPDFVEHFWPLAPELYHRPELEDRRARKGALGGGRGFAEGSAPNSSPRLGSALLGLRLRLPKTRGMAAPEPDRVPQHRPPGRRLRSASKSPLPTTERDPT
jgi:hypothetical protein